MAKRAPRLQFTDEERASPELTAAAKKANKCVDKLEKAEAKIPVRKVKQRVVDSQGKVTTRLSFEEKKPPSKLAHGADVAGDSMLHGLHREIRKSNDGDNSGVDAANTSAETAESAYQMGRSAHHAYQLKPYRAAHRAERKADKANIKALNREFEQQNDGFSSNPYSRWMQKRAIRKEYAAAKAGGATAVHASEITAKAARKSAEVSKKAGDFISRHKKGFLVVGLIAAFILIFTNLFSSCSLMFQGATSTIAASTYPSEDADMLAAEAQYRAMETELQNKLDNYENEHDYDEYHYELDEIEHDPYVLISAITALMDREWTIREVGGILNFLFEKQYILTETVEMEVRYRTETRIGSTIYYDYELEEWVEEEYEYDVQVEYTYYICTVKLENFNLSHVPVYVMSQDQLALYAMYMSTLGNRPDLFRHSVYVGMYYGSEYPKYEIPPEALEDEQFAAIIKEAEKYLGFPYVWGGSSPSTSFDCSGFVSYVYNNCGLGWDLGRRSAEGLRIACAYVSPATAKPGDLIFFQGTYDTPGASHVGIYVGNNTMLHCGDPIQYSSISSSYWQQHFYQFGRLPSP